MSRRNGIYLALLAFVAFGVIVDAFFWPGGTRSFTVNDLVQLIGIVTLSSLWQMADARERGIGRSSLAKLLTVGFVPLGSAVYLFQSRAGNRPWGCIWSSGPGWPPR